MHRAYSLLPRFLVKGQFARRVPAEHLCQAWGDLKMRNDPRHSMDKHDKPQACSVFGSSSLLVPGMAQGPIAERPRHMLAGHKDAVACLAVSSELILAHHFVVVPGTAQGPIAERPQHVLAGHEDAVACLAVSTELILAHHFGVVPGTAQGPIAERPRHVLAGHEDAVACLAVSTELDVVVSGAADGTLLFHTLRRGRWGTRMHCLPCTRLPNCDHLHLQLHYVPAWKVHRTCMCQYAARARRICLTRAETPSAGQSMCAK